MFELFFMNPASQAQAIVAGPKLARQLPAMVAILFAALMVLPQGLLAQTNDQSEAAVLERGTYQINAGDGLSLQVWNEPTLSAQQLLVRPDGFISVPVIGEIRAGGLTVSGVQDAIREGLNRYLKDVPTVVINVIGTSGNQISVLGKVQRPGVFPLRGPMDITQALAMAGGLNSFAAENKIRVLRRDAAGTQSAIRFKYGQIKDGDRLSSNILLQSGDVLLVP